MRYQPLNWPVMKGGDEHVGVALEGAGGEQNVPTALDTMGYLGSLNPQETIIQTENCYATPTQLDQTGVLLTLMAPLTAAPRYQV